MSSSKATEVEDEVPADLRIGDLAAATDVPPRMLRYYEQQGLLQPERGNNGYRRYRESDVAQVHKVRSLIRSGLTTKLIKVLLEMQDSTTWTLQCTRICAEELEHELGELDRRLECQRLSRDTVAEVLQRTRSTS